ncbi:hypothetical protein KVL30_03445 [Helicobacter pylori]|uniref:hypothetical protein n=1 Tax=Helicobacter pylori TaxID=210 RepID=UPI002928E563|nr:hypothetical protein [Helicobacter pylori]MDU9794791.1 hypothetical protein [Helicobacter pylori]WRB38081.1 hypothetical protein KVK24_03260 [Helicobacter pylori]WRB39596.1 hypothetical protein KVL30_03445 [Helicobacter pylori]WRB45248.1 hypothetical protein KVK83_03325 [Helicobacter pylori]WRB48069.1 hypothetical protein KVK28_03325 [Helicobacter pylori]
MAIIRLDSNNNNSEWQMFFDKINCGSPFGVIKEVFFYDFPSNNPNNSPQLKQFLGYKRHFIGFVEIFIEPSEILFFVYENESSATFNLKNYLLVLAKMHCNPTAICYCENKQDKNTHNMKTIKLLSTGYDFGKDLNSIDVEFSNPNTFVQSLLKLESFLHGKTIEFFNNPTNYPPVTLAPWDTPTIPGKTTVEIEEHRKNTTFDQNYNSLHYRQSSVQNIKINEIANDLESGKIVGKKIISDALLGVSCCFMDNENLKDLKKLLSQDQINLSDAITNAINQAENTNGINLTSAIIDKIEYHFRDNTFHFIFNVSNNFLSGKSRLTIEVPRVALENIKLPDMKEICVNQWYINIFINILKYSIYEGSYIIDLHLIDD